MASKKRKYESSYVSYGFTFITERDGTQKPQCFLCSKVLCNTSMKPSKLKEHFKNLHSNYSQDELLVKKPRFEKSGTLKSHGFVPTNKPILEASYRAAYRIGKNKMAHSLGETLIKCICMRRKMFKRKKKVNFIQIASSPSVFEVAFSNFTGSCLSKLRRA